VLFSYTVFLRNNANGNNGLVGSEHRHNSGMRLSSVDYPSRKTSAKAIRFATNITAYMRYHCTVHSVSSATLANLSENQQNIHVMEQFWGSNVILS
jgi:hypothetical protein